MSGRRRVSARLGVVVAAVLLLSASVLLVLALSGNLGEGSFGREVGKGIIQLITIVLVTGVISVFVERYQTDRDREADLARRRDELLRAMLDEGGAAYRDVKQARRMIRATVWGSMSGHEVSLDTYDHHMAAISSAQLTFERLALDARILTDGRVNKSELESSLRAIERWLARLVKEYEQNRRRIAYGDPAAPLTELDQFLDKAGKGSFGKVAKSADMIASSLQSALLQVGTSNEA